MGISESSEVTGPLAQFQSKKADKDDTLAILKSINLTLGDNRLTDQVLTETFGLWWPELERVIQNNPVPQVSRPRRSERALLEEVLERVESLDAN